MFKVLKKSYNKAFVYSKKIAFLRPKNEKAWNDKAQEKWSRIRLAIDLFATSLLTLGVFEMLCSFNIVCLDINIEWLNALLTMLDGIVFIIIQIISAIMKLIVHISSIYSKKMS